MRLSGIVSLVVVLVGGWAVDGACHRPIYEIVCRMFLSSLLF